MGGEGEEVVLAVPRVVTGLTLGVVVDEGDDLQVEIEVEVEVEEEFNELAGDEQFDEAAGDEPGVALVDEVLSDDGDGDDAGRWGGGGGGRLSGEGVVGAVMVMMAGTLGSGDVGGSRCAEYHAARFWCTQSAVIKSSAR